MKDFTRITFIKVLQKKCIGYCRAATTACWIIENSLIVRLFIKSFSLIRRFFIGLGLNFFIVCGKVAIHVNCARKHGTSCMLV